jgi:hypothetical protein
VIAVLGLAGLALVRDVGDDDPGFIAATPSSLPADPPGGIEPAEVAEGFEPFVDHDGSFALSVPVGWETVPLDDATVGRARDRLEDENPRVAASLEQIDRIVADRGLAFAAEPDDQDGFVANLNLLVVPRSTEPLIDTAAAGRAELEAQGFRVGDPQAVEIGERSGLIAAIELDTPTGTIVERQLYLASGYRVYVLTVAGVDASTADRIVGSLRVP